MTFVKSNWSASNILFDNFYNFPALPILSKAPPPPPKQYIFSKTERRKILSRGTFAKINTSLTEFPASNSL